jgi:hypothetical protein
MGRLRISNSVPFRKFLIDSACFLDSHFDLVYEHASCKAHKEGYKEHACNSDALVNEICVGLTLVVVLITEY